MISTSIQAIRELGLQPLALYGLYQLGLKSGWIRRMTPSYRWVDRPLADWLDTEYTTGPDHLPLHPEPRSKSGLEDIQEEITMLSRKFPEIRNTAIEEAEEVLSGRFRLFGGPPVDLGFPPNWYAYAMPEGGKELPEVESGLHWTEYDLAALGGDVKLIWEPARFGWTYPLCRAYILTEDERYFNGFWELFRSWCEHNQPNTGIHWTSGQEVAFRILAMAFAWAVFHTVLEEDFSRGAQLMQVIAVHADRILPTLIYARAQNNNHLIVEGVALYAVGAMFPALSKSREWKELGRKWTIHAIDDQVFSDGGYIQQSTNYQRLALEAGLFAANIAEGYDVSLPPPTNEALGRMTELLAALSKHRDGRLPNFGPNDGARLLPLSSLPFEDYRPALQAGAVMSGEGKIYRSGPWDEERIWLRAGGDAGMDSAPPVHSTREPEVGPMDIESGGLSSDDDSIQKLSDEMLDSRPGRCDFGQAGLYLLEGQNSTGLLRAANFVARPGHSDQLHFDLAWRGCPILRDPGTYLYSGQPPWENTLADAHHHNTVVLDGREPMQRKGRFLWLDWSKASLLGRWHSESRSIEVVAASHNGYKRQGLLQSRTVIRVGDDIWIVIDDVIGEGEHTLRLSWTLGDFPVELLEQELEFKVLGMQGRLKFEGLDLEAGLYSGGELKAGRAVESDPATFGWYSPSYAYLETANQLIVRARVALPARIITTLAMPGADLENLQADLLASIGKKAAVRRIQFQDEVLEI